MTCSHLKELYRVCQTSGLRMSSSDLIHIVCPECGVREVCPSVYSIEYDAAVGVAGGETSVAGGEAGVASGEAGVAGGERDAAESPAEEPPGTA